jgi:hypothetical protein
MKKFAELVRACAQLLSEGVEREWLSVMEWHGQSRLSPEAFGAAVELVEGYVRVAVVRDVGRHRTELRQMAKQVREEFGTLLEGMEARRSMALLCGLPQAERMGYSLKELAGQLGVGLADVQRWEEEAYRQVWERVSERTPFLAWVKQAVGVEDGQVVSVAAGCEERVEEAGGRGPEGQEGLLHEARWNAKFDLREYVGAELELLIRQAAHRVGVEAASRVKGLFSEKEGMAVELVLERMKLEMSEEEARET